MISSILPVYLFVHLQLSPVQFGLIDGLYQGVTAVARLASGIVADRWRRWLVATIGYALSAVCKLGLLATGSTWSVRGGPLGRPSGRASAPLLAMR